ncbi:MAG: hypothetical protein QGH33_01120, partial [Pirellulaceae bacterium]|nr:hypothetical protein [Pirellulaceae bacterium]
MHSLSLAGSNSNKIWGLFEGFETLDQLFRLLDQVRTLADAVQLGSHRKLQGRFAPTQARAPPNLKTPWQFTESELVPYSTEAGGTWGSIFRP